MLDILLMIILLITIIIFIILLFGVRLQVNWKKVDDEYDGCIKILILKKLKVYTINLKSEDEDDESEDEPEGDSEEERDLKELLELIKPCLGNLKTFLHELFGAISINKLENHLVLGFSNFAKTGETIGYVWAISAVLNSALPNTRLSSEPSFKGETLNLKGLANIDISIIKLIVPVINLLLDKNVRTLIKGVLNG